jgi:hypothetical protein
MEPSSQQQPQQPPQEAMALGLPEGYPPTREHLHDVAALPSAMQHRLDRVMLAEGQPPVVPLRPPSWERHENGGPASE